MEQLCTMTSAISESSPESMESKEVEQKLYEVMRLINDSFMDGRQKPLRSVAFSFPTDETREKIELIPEYCTDEWCWTVEEQVCALRQMASRELTRRILECAGIRNDEYLEIFEALPDKIVGIGRAHNLAAHISSAK